MKKLLDTLIQKIIFFNIKINMFQGHPAVKFFSKLNKLFFGYFDPVNIFFDEKNNYLSG